jgi:non-specific serine/threonine protein kinase/serine/threonine-protein kinase
VEEVDGKPVPRIIDFGLAKATAQALTAETLFTRAGAIVGTPAYMSPEQAGSTGADIDTRTDVYSLGVVLYELLAGALPLDFHELAFDEILRRMREEEAPRPSAKLRTLGEQSGTAAQNRGCDPPTLARQLRGDLDAIALKALEKERSRRYATPMELAADIGRYLRNEPVMAHPASGAYRARKYIRRHRMGAAVAAGLVAVLVSFGVAQTLQLRRIMIERDRADRERDRATRVADFMTGMFKVSDPSAARGNSITAREILDKASKEIDTGLSKDPDLISLHGDPRFAALVADAKERAAAAQKSKFVETKLTFGRVGDVREILGSDLAGATSGKVQVVTPSGTLSSNVPFRVLP